MSTGAGKDVGSDDAGGDSSNPHRSNPSVELLPTAGAKIDSFATAEMVDNNGLVTIVGRIALVAVVIGLFFVFARGGQRGTGEAARPGDPPIVDALEGALTPGVGTAEFRPWPDPPEDHDPHVAGRPGNQEPISEDSVGKTLVYVNERGRPTVIDLSTGDQRELDIAGPRDRDSFLVEFGRIVAMPGSGADLPKSQGRAFNFTVERSPVPGTVSSDDDATAPSLSGPTLCLDEGGCVGAALLAGTFGDDLNRVESIGGSETAVQAIAEVVGSNWWRKDGRWTFFSLDPSTDSETQLRVPTPMNSAVVWLVEQLPPVLG